MSSGADQTVKSNMSSSFIFEPFSVALKGVIQFQGKVVILHLDFKELMIELVVIMLCHGYSLCSYVPLFLLYLGHTAVLGWFAGL